MNAIPYDRPEEEWDSYEDEQDAALPGRPRRKVLTWWSAGLFAVILGAVGFYAGVRVEKNQLSNSTSTSAFSAAGAGRVRAPPPGTGAAGRDGRGRGRSRRGRRWRRFRGSVRRRRGRGSATFGTVEQHQRELPVRHRHFRQHRQGHAVERDQGHQERHGGQEGRATGRPRGRLGGQGLERHGQRDHGQRHGRQSRGRGKRRLGQLERREQRIVRRQLTVRRRLSSIEITKGTRRLKLIGKAPRGALLMFAVLALGCLIAACGSASSSSNTAGASSTGTTTTSASAAPGGGR